MLFAAAGSGNDFGCERSSAGDRSLKAAKKEPLVSCHELRPLSCLSRFWRGGVFGSEEVIFASVFVRRKAKVLFSNQV